MDTKDKPNQLKRAMKCVDKLKEVIDECEVERLIYQPLSNVVGMAQNGPPDGEADGSIDEDTWNDLSKLVRSLGLVLISLDKITST